MFLPGFVCLRISRTVQKVVDKIFREIFTLAKFWDKEELSRFWGGQDLVSQTFLHSACYYIEHQCALSTFACYMWHYQSFMETHYRIALKLLLFV